MDNYNTETESYSESDSDGGQPSPNRGHRQGQVPSAAKESVGASNIAQQARSAALGSCTVGAASSGRSLGLD